MKLKSLEIETLVNFLYELEKPKILPKHKKVISEFLEIKANKKSKQVDVANKIVEDFLNTTQFQTQELPNNNTNINIDEIFNNQEFIQKVKQLFPPFGYGGGLNARDVESIVDYKISKIPPIVPIPLNPKYFGSDSNGNWRMQQIGDELITEYKYNGAWITQCSCKAINLVDNVIITEDETPIITEDGVFLEYA